MKKMATSSRVVDEPVVSHPSDDRPVAGDPGRDQGSGISDPPPAEQVQMIPLERLVDSRSNPRRTMNNADLEELAASIREHGIQVPLLVRPGWANLDSGLPAYEIVCGHRRAAAAAFADHLLAPCLVREMDDAMAAEIALIDNLQRVDVPAMEEAEAFSALLERLHSIAAVAAKVGKEQGYVAKRLKLCILGEATRRALEEKLIAIDHALLLARLNGDEQDEVLKWCLDQQAGVKTPVEKVIEDRVMKRAERAAQDLEERRGWHEWQPQTAQSLKQHIEEDGGTPLVRAPWPLDMAELAGDVCPCDVCPKNTSANAPLFGDLNIGAATCTDRACFEEKTASWVRIQARMSEGTPAPLRVSWKSTSTAPRQEKDGGGPVLSQVFKFGQWLDIDKKGTRCEHARPAVTVDWSDAGVRGFMGGGDKVRKPGEIIQVCVQPKCKAHPKSYEKQARPNGGGGQSREAYEEQQRKRKEAVLVENRVRMGGACAVVSKIKTLPQAALRKLLLDAVEYADWEPSIIEEHLLPKFIATLKQAAFSSVAFAQAVAALYIAENGLYLEDYHAPADHRDDYIEALKQLGTDPTPAWQPKKPAVKKKPAAGAAKKKTRPKKAARKAGRK